MILTMNFSAAIGEFFRVLPLGGGPPPGAPLGCVVGRRALGFLFGDRAQGLVEAPRPVGLTSWQSLTKMFADKIPSSLRHSYFHFSVFLHFLELHRHLISTKGLGDRWARGSLFIHHTPV